MIFLVQSLRLLLFFGPNCMSGHSKWSTIKRQKAVTDARRSSVFTKMGRLITIAVRTGGKDPSMNFRLRLAIDQAKNANMPNDNIERAIKSGAGELKGDQIKEVVYEGFGPGGAAVIVNGITDNSNRSVAEVRSVFQKFDGRLGAQNSVSWMFQLRGVIRIQLSQLGKKTVEDIELGIIDAGAEDVNVTADSIEATASPEQLKTIGQWLQAQGITGYEANTEFVPQTTVPLDQATRQSLYTLLEALDELPDVTDVFSNDV